MKPRDILWIGCLTLTILSYSCKNNNNNKGNSASEGGSSNSKLVTLHHSYFTDLDSVRTRKPSSTVMNALMEYISNTPKGADVYVNIYLFNYDPLISAIEAAEKRGVNIQLLIDHSRKASINTNTKTIPRLDSILGRNNITVVENDISKIAIDHNKSILFSKIDIPGKGIAKNVVFSTSHNFTEAGTHKVQDAIVMTNKPLYKAFLNNWKAIKSHATSGMKNIDYKEVRVGDSIYAQFFPRRYDGEWDKKDTYIKILDQIGDYSLTKVRVVMSDWSRIEVARKLTELQKKGVSVEVITKDKANNSKVLKELEKLESAGGYVKVLDMSKINNHSKVMMIKGTWKGEPHQKILNTGSHNFTYNALKNNNEVLLTLVDSGFFDDYWNYFDQMKEKL